MDNSKLQGIIKGFSGHDRNSFVRFIASPWLNTNEAIIALFPIIDESIRKQKPLSRTELYKRLYPERKYRDKEMRYLLTDLTRCLENYLACRELFANEALLFQLKLKGLAKKDCEKAYDYEHNRFEKWHRSRHSRDADHYLSTFLMHYQHQQYAFRKSKRKKVIRFDELMKELDVFYLARKLQLMAESANAQNILEAEYTVHLSEEIRKLATDKDFSGIPVIEIYYQVLMSIISSETEQHFRQLRTLLSRHAGIFPVSELNDLYQYIRNYCIKKINTGDMSYQPVLFDIYQEILTNKRLLRNEYLSQWEFKNITTLGLRLGHMKWVENFIRKYSYYLNPEEKRNAVLYNLANVHFHKKDYSAALRLFQRVVFTDVYYQLDARSIQLKIYYEQGDEEALLFHAAAFKVFLSRNKLISAYQRTIYRNLVNFAIRLVHAGTARRKIEILKQKLSRTPQVADHQWIRQMMDEALS